MESSTRGFAQPPAAQQGIYVIATTLRWKARPAQCVDGESSTALISSVMYFESVHCFLKGDESTQTSWLPLSTSLRLI